MSLSRKACKRFKCTDHVLFTYVLDKSWCVILRKCLWNSHGHNIGGERHQDGPGVLEWGGGATLRTLEAQSGSFKARFCSVCNG